MYIADPYDPDEFDTKIDSRPCTACAGDIRKCNGMCNGYLGISQAPKPTAEVQAIRARKRREREDAILAQADAIRSQRAAA